MENRKPNTLLTVALVLIVLAALICLIIFLCTRGKPADPAEANVPVNTGEQGEPSDTGEAPEDSTPVETAPVYDTQAFQAGLDDSIDGLDSVWQVAVADLADGAKYTSVTNCKQTDLMVAADLTKLYLMAAAYHKVAAGELEEAQITDLVSRMIREENAAAANELTELLGGGDADKGRAVVNDFALSVGCSHTEYNRLFAESGTQNYTTAEDCAALLQQIAEGSCVSPEASAAMREMLAGLEGDRIPAGLPAGASCLHLSATLSGTCCADVAIVTTEARSFVLVILCNNPYTSEGATKRCVQVTELVCDYLA